MAQMIVPNLTAFDVELREALQAIERTINKGGQGQGGGTTILNGTVPPTSGVGTTGDYYLDTNTHILYGPKAGTSWPVAIISDTGAGGAVAYVHDQGVAAVTWTINHGLSFRPNVAIVDSGGSECEGDVQYTSATQVVVTFSAAFAGKAYLS